MAQESTLYGDKAYYKAEDKLHWEAAAGTYRVNKSGQADARSGTGSTPRGRGSARACEHAFHVVKRLWGFTKVRYRGLAKNTTRAFAAFALANLYLVRHRLAPQGT